MPRPRLLDLFCGAGGAGVGYARAGFDVVGVDTALQRRYPFAFIQADAMTFPLDGFDVIHASPPCQAFTRARHIHGLAHPDLLAPIRERLQHTRVPWVIENVQGAPMPQFTMLCGTHFGLKVYRHRQFESSHLIAPAGKCQHAYSLPRGFVCIAGGKAKGHQRGNRDNHYERASPDYARRAMGCEWMTLQELSQSIPPAYTEWVGRQMMEAIHA